MTVATALVTQRVPRTVRACENSKSHRKRARPQATQRLARPQPLPSCGGGRGQGHSSNSALTHCLYSHQYRGFVFYKVGGSGEVCFSFGSNLLFVSIQKHGNSLGKHLKSKLYSLELFLKEGGPTLANCRERAGLHAAGEGEPCREQTQWQVANRGEDRGEFLGILVSWACLGHELALTTRLRGLLRGGSCLPDRPPNLHPPSFLHRSE